MEFNACSHVTTSPLYVAIRPMTPMRVLLDIDSPSLMGLPSRMLAKSSSCSCWYMFPSLALRGMRQGFCPSMTQEFRLVEPSSAAWPPVP